MGSHTRSRDPVPISSHFRPLDIVPNRDRQLILPSTQELSKGVKWLEERGSSSKKLPYPVPAAPLHMKVVCLTRIMTDLITAQPSGLVEGWTHGNVYFGWSYVVPAFRTASVAVFREHKGIDWFYAVSSVLKRRLGLGDETGVRTTRSLFECSKSSAIPRQDS